MKRQIPIVYTVPNACRQSQTSRITERPRKEQIKANNTQLTYNLPADGQIDVKRSGQGKGFAVILTLRATAGVEGSCGLIGITRERFQVSGFVFNEESVGFTLFSS